MLALGQNALGERGGDLVFRLKQQKLHAIAGAYISRMAVQPSQARKAAINTLVVSGKRDGWLDKLDFFYLLAAHDAQAARLNLVASDSLTPFNNPVFTPDRGYKGDGSSAYLETVFNQSILPKAGGPADANASWLVGVREPGLSGQFVMGATTGVRFALIHRSSLTEMSFRNGQGTVLDVVPVGGTGRFASSRQSTAGAKSYFNGALVMQGTASAQSSANAAVLLFRGGTAYSVAQVTHFAAGAALSDAEQAAADSAISTYLQSVGAE